MNAKGKIQSQVSFPPFIDISSDPAGIKLKVPGKRALQKNPASSLVQLHAFALLSLDTVNWAEGWALL